MRKLKALFATLILALFLLAALIYPQHALAQSVNWLALQSDTTAIAIPGQVINVALHGSLNVPIAGAAMTLRYDPACFRVIGHHPGNLLPGATVYAQAQAGQFDLVYDLPDTSRGLTGEGSLVTLQLEALKLCTSDLSVAADSILLAVLDKNGLTTKLPGVEYRGLRIHLLPGNALPANKPVILPTKAQIGLQNNLNDLIFLVLIIFPISGAMIYFLRRRSKRPGRPSSTPKFLSASEAAVLLRAGSADKSIKRSRSN
jgi:hypothetical protein